MEISWIISRLLDPVVVGPATAIIGVFKSGMRGEALAQFVSVLFLAIIAPPVLFILHAVKTGKVTSWDISNRRQRVYVLLIFLLFIIFDLEVVHIIGNDFIRSLFRSFFVWLLGFFFITLKWKISAHVGILTFCILLMIAWYGAGLTPLLLLVPVLAWARVTSGQHTQAQTIGGFIYSLTVWIIMRVHS